MSEFVARVLLSLPSFEKSDGAQLEAGIRDLEKQGFTILEAVRFCENLQEFGCSDPEYVALYRMDQVRLQVLKRQVK